MEKDNSFKYGALTIKCHQCGGEEIIEDLVTDGRAIYLFNNTDSFMKLKCSKCDITMEISLQPSKEVPEEDIIIDEEELEAEITEDTYEELSEEIISEEVI